MLLRAVAFVFVAMTQMEPAPDTTSQVVSSDTTSQQVVSFGLLGVVTLLLLTGVLQTYAGYRAYKEHVNRFAIMENAYATASRDLTIALEQDDLQRALLITRHIGVLALQEISDWLILHRERPPEISPV